MRAELLAEKEGRDTENVNAAKMAEDRQSIVVFFFGAYVSEISGGISSHWRIHGSFKWKFVAQNGSLPWGLYNNIQ